MIAFQLQIHQTILCFVMLCLGIQKAHFCFARGLPISFCQQGIRERLLNWGKKKGLPICFLWSAYVLDVPVGVTSLVLLQPSRGSFFLEKQWNSTFSYSITFRSSLCNTCPLLRFQNKLAITPHPHHREWPGFQHDNALALWSKTHQ